MMPLCRAERIGVIPWSPLARGFLVGNRQRADWGETTRAKSDDYAQGMYYADQDFEIVDRVVEIAKARGVAPAQVAIAWVLRQPGVTAPIVGTSKMAQLDQAVVPARRRPPPGIAGASRHQLVGPAIPSRSLSFQLGLCFGYWSSA